MNALFMFYMFGGRDVGGVGVPETIGHIKSYIHIMLVGVRDLQLVKLYSMFMFGGGAGEAGCFLPVTKCYIHINVYCPECPPGGTIGHPGGQQKKYLPFGHGRDLVAFNGTGL